jgi:hypothetical protein
MKQKVTRVGGRGLLICLICCMLAILASTGVMANGASPVRALPDEVTPGEEFQVTVTFTSPAANFTAIGLADVAPAGWSVTVDKTWCTPDADVDNNPTPEEADYIWFGPYAAGVGFTALYDVQVPVSASPGIYTFNGTLEYYIGQAGPNVEPIGGDYQVEVVREAWSANVGGSPKATFASSDTVYATGTGFAPGQDVDIYVVNATDWPVPYGDTIPADLSGGLETVTPDGSGDLPVALVWAPSLTVGEYYLVFDVRPYEEYEQGDVSYYFEVTSGGTAPVGGTAYPLNKVAILAPWIALAAIVAGVSLLVLRRRRAQG